MKESHPELTEDKLLTLFDELENEINRRRDFILDKDDSKTLAEGLKYRYNPRDKLSVNVKQENWLSLGDWLISKAIYKVF